MNKDDLVSCYYCCTSFNKEDIEFYDNVDKDFCPRCKIPAITSYMEEDELNKHHCRQFNHSVSLKKNFKSIDEIERHYCHCPQVLCCVNCDTDSKNKALDKWGFKRHSKAIEGGLISFIRWLSNYKGTN